VPLELDFEYSKRSRFLQNINIVLNAEKKAMRLREFIITRLLMTIPTVLLLATIVFIVMRVMPGDPVVSLMGSKVGSEEQIEIIRHALGLDRPLHIQYTEYIFNLVRGDLGYSMVRSNPVLEEILTHLPATLELTLWSMALAIPLGVYLGTVAAKRQGGKIDSVIRIGALVRWCIPVFWLGIMLQIVAVLYIPFFPLSGRLSAQITLNKITGLYVLDSILTGNTAAFIDSVKHLLLPVFTLGTTMAASLARLSRANVIEVLGEEYIKVTRLKGCPEKTIIQKHALPNALIPILTYAGLQIAMLMGGAMLTETTFSWPGLGRLLLFAIGYRDFTLIQGCIVFWALIIGLVNLIVDILYAIIDPRVRY